MDGWRRHAEVSLHLPFGGRSAIDARVGVDEGQILALLGCEAGSVPARHLIPHGRKPIRRGRSGWLSPFRRAVKGFGFVAQDRGGKDVFVHATTVDRSGLSELPEGQRVRMQISQGQKGPEARSIEILG